MDSGPQSNFGSITGHTNFLGNQFVGPVSITNQPKQEDDLLRHLGRTNPRLDKDRIEATKGPLLEDVYRWIFEHHDYQEWMKDPGSALLWVKGGPGKGKTMLLCGLIDQLENETSVSYFFCQASDTRLNNATNVLLGLTYHLINQQPSLRSHFEKEYSRAGQELFEDINAWVALSRIFKCILDDPHLQSTILIIDALDECETDLSMLLDLIQTPSSRVKWIVSSRNRPDIEEQLQVARRLSLELNSELISYAVHVYIQLRVNRLAQQKGYDDSLRYYVETYLIEKANDTFLWVALVCERLAAREVTKRSTRDTLESFPAGLSPLYKRMLREVDATHDKIFCKRILAITLVAFQPLTLNEVRALDKSLRDAVEDIDDMEELVANCGSFLTIRAHTIYFVHQSAKEFLLKDVEASHQIFPSGEQREHLDVFAQSLHILSPVLRRDIYGLKNPGISIRQITRPNPDPLIEARYSCIYWIDHFVHGQACGNTHHDPTAQDKERLYTFFSKKYIYWLEALGLLGCVSKGIVSISRLRDLPQIGHEVHDLVEDAHRFILYFHSAIEASPFQVYASGLAFAPEESIVRKLFCNEMYGWISSRPRTRPYWSECLQTIEASGYVKSMAFSPKSDFITSLVGANVCTWSAATGELQHQFRLEDGFGSVAFSSDAKLLACCSMTALKIWSTATYTLKLHISGHDINCIAFSPDSKLIACACAFGVQISLVQTGHLLYTLPSFGPVRAITFSFDSMLLKLRLGDSIQVWSVNTGELQSTIGLTGYGILLLAISPNLDLLAWREHCLLRITSAVTGESQRTFTVPNSVVSVVFSPDSKLLACGTHGSIQIWSVATGVIQYRFQDYSRHYIPIMAFSSDARFLAASSQDSIQIFPTATSASQQTTELAGYANPFIAVAFSSDLKLLASSSVRSVQIHSGTTGKLLHTLEVSSSVAKMTFSPDSTLLAWTSFHQNGYRVEIYSTMTKRLQQIFEDNDKVVEMTFSPDSTLLAWISFNTGPKGDLYTTVDIYSTVTGLQRTLEGVDARSMAFSPDSNLLVLRLRDGTVRIWTAATGELQNIREDHDISRSLLDNQIISMYGLGIDGNWITFLGVNLLWLPVDFRPSCFTISGPTIAIGCRSGTMVILRLDVDKLGWVERIIY
ncbi:beta transducin-like protein HET-D2Y [Xylaria telfairii]|nr:beta transducin-like protein HET-D2Y [Xylaria telfairii]